MRAELELTGGGVYKGGRTLFSRSFRDDSFIPFPEREYLIKFLNLDYVSTTLKLSPSSQRHPNHS